MQEEPDGWTSPLASSLPVSVPRLLILTEVNFRLGVSEVCLRSPRDLGSTWPHFLSSGCLWAPSPGGGHHMLSEWGCLA